MSGEDWMNDIIPLTEYDVEIEELDNLLDELIDDGYKSQEIELQQPAPQPSPLRLPPRLIRVEEKDVFEWHFKPCSPPKWKFTPTSRAMNIMDRRLPNACIGFKEVKHDLPKKRKFIPLNPNDDLYATPPGGTGVVMLEGGNVYYHKKSRRYFF